MKVLDVIRITNNQEDFCLFSEKSNNLLIKYSIYNVIVKYIVSFKKTYTEGAVDSTNIVCIILNNIRFIHEYTKSCIIYS